MWLTPIRSTKRTTSTRTRIEPVSRTASLGRPVPDGRVSRMARLGGLATGVAGSMLAEGIRQLSKGNRPRVGDLLLTPDNVRRVAEQLSHLRGAAMKVGQLLSMDAGEFLPPELGQILARLRADAHPMPMSQLVRVLEHNWGSGWDNHFRRFSFTPLAAASIGQVHAAELHDGRPLAIKVQYPGVRRSISSDVDNVATLLRLSGLLPRDLAIGPLLEEAKQQLHDEADYLKESQYLLQYRELLQDMPDFDLPEVHPDLTTPDILAMSRVGGVPIEQMADATQEQRDRAVGGLFSLLFREIFEFGLVQTDPNFANYHYEAESRRVILLDFGATRAYSPALAHHYACLLAAGMREDEPALNRAAAAIGYFQAAITEHHRRQVLDIFRLACEPLRHLGPYDFGRSDLARRVRHAGMALGLDPDYWHTPPADALFLHRKIGGLYLLAVRLRARVDVRSL